MALIASVVLVALAAGIWDYRTLRIPNWLTLGAAASGLLLAIFGVGAPGGVTGSLQGLLAGGLIMLPFFIIGTMGGGDVKLAAAFGALGGLGFALNTLFVGSILGGLFTLCLVCRKGFGATIKKVYQDLVALVIFRSKIDLSGQDMVLPYGVFISIGAVVSLFYEVIKIAA